MMNNNADPVILGKILLLQSTLHAMNEDAAMARFVCRGLASVPGIEAVSIFIRGNYISESKTAPYSAVECEKLFDLFTKDKAAGHESLPKKDDTIDILKIETIFTLYGFLIVTIKKKEIYREYKQYIENTVNLVALVIENSTQKEELLRNKENLEKTVKERTHELAAALEEKKILLRELYHRTKNNMQVIRSMLSLQAEGTKNELVQKIFRDTENRIQTMALVHQKLYQSQDLSQINLKNYFFDLAQMVMHSYGVMSERVSLILEIEDIFVLIDTAIPCGLVLNELLSNVCKHAFPGSMKGEISIRVSGTKQGEINLFFSDNGVGVSKDFDFRKQKTLGLQTILAICEHQLQGKVIFETKQGVGYHIRLNDSLYTNRMKHETTNL
ncbi:MAG: hypothetical protein GY754_18990 [bacterium]|nr:hypothetical protein [bacterium]